MFDRETAAIGFGDRPARLRRGLLASTALTAVVAFAGLLLAAPALADGGNSGFVNGTGGAGGADSATGAGTAGQDGVSDFASGAGGGGGAGATGGAGGLARDVLGNTVSNSGGAGGATAGAAGGNGTTDASGPNGGGGGGGGAHGSVGAALPGAASSGGNGGNGGGSTDPSVGSHGGGGGAGGYGAVVTGAYSGPVSVALSGGNGGNGGDGNKTGGDGGSGGIGLLFTDTGVDATLHAAITGGNGGAAGVGNNSNGVAGLGGVGISGQSLTLTLSAGGSVAGGQAGGVGVRADSILFIGGSNTLNLGTGTAALTGNLEVSSGASLALGVSSGAATVDQGIVGGGALSKSGSGSLALTGNLSVGVITVDGGTLTLSGTNTITSLTLKNGSTLSLQSNGAAGGSTSRIDAVDPVIDYADTVNNATPIVVFDATTQLQVLVGSATQSGVISENSAGQPIEKIGAGTLALDNTETYTGATKITAGTLTLGTVGDISASSGVDTTAAGTFDISGHTGDVTITSLTGLAGGQVTLGTNGLVLSNASQTFAGVIAGSGGLTVSGGTETLTGTNTYSGATTISGGTLALGTTGDISASSGVDTTAAGTFDISGHTGDATITSLTGLAGGQVTLGANGLVLSNASQTFAGVIAGSGGLTVSGGTETLTGTNTYSGATTISGGGTVVANSSAALGDGSATNTLVFNTGTLQASGDITSPATRGVTMTGAGTIDTGSNTVEIGGAFTGAGALTKSGSGTLNLTGNSYQYTGDTTVAAGTLKVNNAGTQGAAGALNPGFGAAGSTLTVQAGATLGGSGLIGGNVVVADSGILAAGNSPGTLSIAGNLTLNNASVSNFELNTPGQVGQAPTAPGNDLVSVGGNLTLDGTVNLTPAVSGYYRLFNYGGALTDNGASVTTSLGGSTASLLTNINHQVNASVSVGGQLVQYWDGADMAGQTGDSGTGTVDGGTGTWNAANTNWTTATGSGINDQWRSQVGVFMGTAGTVTVAGTQAFEGLQFSSTGYLVTGGALDMTGNPSGNAAASFVNVDAAVIAEIASPIGSTTSKGLDKLGTGTLILSGANTYAGLTDVQAGVLNIRNSGALGTTAAGTTVASGAALELQGGIAVGAEALSIAGTGVGGTGALRNVSGANSFGGAVTLTADSLIQSDAGTLTLGSSIGGTNVNLTLGGAGDGEVQGAIGTGAGTLTKQGAGVWTLDAVNTYSGATSVGAGTLALKGAGSVAASSGVGLTAAGAKFDISQTAAGTTVATLAGVAGSEVDLGARTLTIANAGTFDGNLVDGGIGGGVGGGVTIAGGNLTLTSAGNTYTGPTQIDGGATLTAGAANATSAFSAVNVDGTLQLGNFSTTINGLSGTGVVDLNNGATGQTLTAGAVSGSESFDLDVSPGTNSTDRIAATTFAGAHTANFNVHNLSLGDLLVVSTTAPPGGSLVATGLPTTGVIIGQIQQKPDGYHAVFSANPVLGSIAGNISLVEATIGNVVNRPSSPFVSGLAADVDPGHCGAGPWLRGTGGRASATGTATAMGGTSTSTVDLGYHGVQGGLDLACFNLQSSGVDVAVGAIGGINGGTTSQDLGGNGVTNAAFDQNYYGLYATVAKGQFAADLQARVDNTHYNFNNPSLGLVDAPLDSRRYTVSGSASYALDLHGVSLVPTAGFSASRTTSSTLNFITGQTLTPDASLSLVGFLGASLAKTIILPDQKSAVTPFVTGTVYNDFAANPTAQLGDGKGGFETITSQNLGLLGEGSIGLNYVSILGDNGIGGPKQVNASVRGDFKYSDRVRGAGITAQARVQF